MKKKYNLALTPITKSDVIIQASQAFSGIADKYILGKNSLLHVTLYQFEIEESAIEKSWKEVCEIWKEKPIKLVFEKVSCLTFDNNIYWISLVPSEVEILHKMHGKIAGGIKLPVKKDFDPHMTLINTRDKSCEREVSKFLVSYELIGDDFVLKLGECDDVGQFTRFVCQV